MTVKKVQSKIILLSSLMFVLLFDNYIRPPGVRVFDFLGVLILLAFMGVGVIKIHSIWRPSPLHLFLIVFTVLYLMPVGFSSYNSLAFIPFLLGAGLFLLLVNNKEFYLCHERIIRCAILLASIALILQFALYLTTGELLSFLMLVTEEQTRSNFAGLVIRPTGFYIEPGSHALAVVILLLTYWTKNNYRFDFLSILASISILLSMSLAGLIGLMAATSIIILKKSPSKGIIYGVFLVLVFVVIAVSAPKAVIEAVDLVFFERFEKLRQGTDGSANDRITKLDHNCIGFIYENNPLGLFIGSGLTSKEFTPHCGANNIAWAIFNYGLFIPLLLLLPLIWRFRRKPLILLSIAYLAFSSQLSSYMFIWWYFAILLGPMSRVITVSKVRKALDKNEIQDAVRAS